MMDYPRILFSELHLGNFLTLWNFKAGKPTSKLKHVHNQRFLTSRIGSKNLRAKSIDDLVTSRSITGRKYFPDYDMLDTMIASALKKLLTHVRFRKKVSVEEQRGQKDDPLLPGRQTAHMIYEHFRASGAFEAVQSLSDLFDIRMQNDDV